MNLSIRGDSLLCKPETQPQPVLTVSNLTYILFNKDKNRIKNAKQFDTQFFCVKTVLRQNLYYWPTLREVLKPALSRVGDRLSYRTRAMSEREIESAVQSAAYQLIMREWISGSLDRCLSVMVIPAKFVLNWKLTWVGRVWEHSFSHKSTFKESLVFVFQM